MLGENLKMNKLSYLSTLALLAIVPNAYAKENVNRIIFNHTMFSDVVKGSYANFGLRDLEFGQLDVRYRKPFGQYWNFTAGEDECIPHPSSRVLIIVNKLDNIECWPEAEF